MSETPPTSQGEYSTGLDDEQAFEASLTSDTLTEEDTQIHLDNGHEPPRVEIVGSQPAWVGKRMGRFKLMRLLGEGAMGRVVQALDVNLRRIVAIKVLRKRVTGIDQQHAVEQFLREARAAAAIEHPNIVRIFEINEHAGWWYIAMEMVEGGTLREIIKAAGPMPPSRACMFIADAAGALAAAHQRGIIHRDVKPNNLMISREGRCKLSDFGLVRYDDPNDPFDFTDKSVGTPKYMSPEIIRQEAPTAAADIYSLGATLYYALTGHGPFTAESLTKLCKKHLDEPPPDVRDQVPEASVSLARLVQLMLSKDPAERPSAVDVAAALRGEVIDHPEDASGSYPLGGTVTGRGAHEKTRVFDWKKRRRSIWLGVGLLVIALGAAAGVLVSQRPAGPTPLSSMYPQAPASYGTRHADQPPPQTDTERPAPPFSWVGKVQPPADAKFVASESGYHYWPLDAAQARLIRADLVVFYPTEQAAQNAGKEPQ